MTPKPDHDTRVMRCAIAVGRFCIYFVTFFMLCNNLFTSIASNSMMVSWLQITTSSLANNLSLNMPSEQNTTQGVIEETKRIVDK